MPTSCRSCPSWMEEARLMVDLVIPTAIVELSSAAPPALTASYVGTRLGSHCLDGFTLATLTGNLLSLSLLFGLYTASDTLSPQAHGSGNYKQVGLLAMRGYVIGLVLIMPINILLWLYMHVFLQAMHQDAESARLALQFFRVIVLGVPFYALFVVTWKYLSAQAVMVPLVVASVVACGLVLPACLELLIPLFGFRGSALAIVIYQASQAMLLLGYLWLRKPFHPSTWPGLGALKEALEWKPILEYIKLGCGGILGMSEWWFWEVVALIIGTYGVVPLSVHTIPTQVITVTFMVSLSIGIALSVRLGATLPHSVPRAKALVFWCHVTSYILFAIGSRLLYTQRLRIFSWFTTEDEVLEGVERIWYKVAVYFFVVSVFGVNMGTAWGLGMQWTLGVVTTFFLWVIGLPSMYYFATIRGGGIDAAWTCMTPPYILMNFVLLIAFYVKDWNRISADIRKREGMDRIEQDLLFETEYGAIEETLVSKGDAEEEEKKADEERF